MSIDRSVVDPPVAAHDPARRVSAALALPHTPVTEVFGAAANPEDPEFVDLCRICWTHWPCLPAWLSGLHLIEEQRERERYQLAQDYIFGQLEIANRAPF